MYPTNSNDPKKPTRARMILWLVGGGIGLYLVITGIVGIIANGA